MFSAILLAGGQNQRMNSPLPKVFHPVAGKPMLLRLTQALKKAGVETIYIVISPLGEKLVKKINFDPQIHFFVQEKPLGTADAVRCVPVEKLNGPILIANADHPLITDKEIKNIFAEFNESKSPFSIVTAHLKKPTHFGRIIRNLNSPIAIIEEKDATDETLKIKEVNTGIFLLDSTVLKKISSNDSNSDTR